MGAEPLPTSHGLVTDPSQGQPDAEAIEPHVLDPDEERLLRRLDGVAVFLGGPANVIMQLSWPEVGYGVVESRVHSGSAMKRPFKRFRTTIGYLGVALLGTDELRDAFREAINGQHRQVRSTPDSPVRYNAFNRELQLWVASCLYYGSRDFVVRMHGPMSDHEEEVLLRSAARLGTSLQVPEDMWHSDRAAFEAYWAEGLARVRIDPPVRKYLMTILDHEILPFPLNKLAGPLGRWVNTGFLPPEIRGAMGLSWSVRDERRHARLVRLIGRLNEPLPRLIRLFPLNAMMLNLRLRHRFGKPLV
jgi:uncharacterized protein (DUF2236 family)